MALSLNREIPIADIDRIYDRRMDVSDIRPRDPMSAIQLQEFDLNENGELSWTEVDTWVRQKIGDPPPCGCSLGPMYNRAEAVKVEILAMQARTPLDSLRIWLHRQLSKG